MVKRRTDNQKLQQEIEVERNHNKTRSTTNNKLVENGKTQQLLIDTFTKKNKVMKEQSTTKETDLQQCNEIKNDLSTEIKGLHQQKMNLPRKFKI